MSFCSPPDTLILDSCVQEHERLDLCLKLLCGLLSKWWPWAAHTSPDLAVRTGSLQCWSFPGPLGWQGPCVTPGNNALPQGSGVELPLPLPESPALLRLEPTEVGASNG